jgi:hypothetical protein
MKQGQHYLSQKHLSYWSSAKENIYRCDIKTGEIKLLPIKSVAKKNNEWTKELENPIFSEFEGQYPKVIEWLEARNEITNEIKLFLKMLKSILYSRAPKQKGNTDRIVKELSSFAHHEPTVNDNTAAMFAVLTVHNTVFQNNKSYVVIVVAPQGMTFVITDNPGARYLPLTPKMCLLLHTVEEMENKERYFYVDAEIVNKINEENIRMADNYIFSLEENHPDIINYFV